MIAFNFQEKEAIELAADAINAGIFNDLGSGGCPNVRIIRKDGTTDFLYEYRKQNKVEEYRRQYRRPTTLDLPKGTVSKWFIFDIMNSCHFRNSYTCRTLICTSLGLFVVKVCSLIYMERHSINDFNSVYLSN